jgi:hypothetical protein
VFEVNGRMPGDRNEKKHEKKNQRPAGQTSLFCSRFFVLLIPLSGKERNSALTFCFFYVKVKERRRTKKHKLKYTQTQQPEKSFQACPGIP